MTDYIIPKEVTKLSPVSERACLVISSCCGGTFMSFSQRKSFQSSASTRLFSLGLVLGLPQHEGKPQGEEEETKKN